MNKTKNKFLIVQRDNCQEDQKTSFSYLAIM
jgi:hypothetical protein